MVNQILTQLYLQGNYNTHHFVIFSFLLTLIFQHLKIGCKNYIWSIKCIIVLKYSALTGRNLALRIRMSNTWRYY